MLDLANNDDNCDSTINTDFCDDFKCDSVGDYGVRLCWQIAVPISGWLMNHFNGKRIFISAVIAFGITSVLLVLVECDEFYYFQITTRL